MLYTHLHFEGLDADELGVAGVLGPVGHRPLQRPEVTVVHLDQYCVTNPLQRPEVTVVHLDQ